MNTSAASVSGYAVSPARSLRFLRGLAWTGFILGMLFVIAFGIAPALFGGGCGTSAAIVGGAAVFLFAMRRIKSARARFSFSTVRQNSPR